LPEQAAPLDFLLFLATKSHRLLGYLTPDDVFYGRGDSRLAKRRKKLHIARINRQEYWQAQAANP
jgi:hypothetical protein